MTKNKTISKSQTISFLDIIKAPFCFNILKEKQVNNKVTISYSIILLISILIITTFINHLNITVKSIFINIIGLILLTVITYGLFYIFLNSYENKYKNFFESLFVATSLIFPFIFIGHIFSLLIYLLEKNIFISILLFLILLLIIYMLVSFVISFKIYYRISAFRVLSSLMLTISILTIIFILFYFNYLISLMI